MTKLWVGIGVETLLFVFCAGYIFFVKDATAMTILAVLLFSRLHMNSYFEFKNEERTMLLYATVLAKIKHAYNIPDWQISKFIDEAAKEKK